MGSGGGAKCEYGKPGEARLCRVRRVVCDTTLNGELGRAAKAGVCFWNERVERRPKGRAALSRSPFAKPPALPEVADSLSPLRGEGSE